MGAESLTRPVRQNEPAFASVRHRCGNRRPTAAWDTLDRVELLLRSVPGVVAFCALLRSPTNCGGSVAFQDSELAVVDQVLGGAAVRSRILLGDARGFVGCCCREWKRPMTLVNHSMPNPVTGANRRHRYTLNAACKSGRGVHAPNRTSAAGRSASRWA